MADDFPSDYLYSLGRARRDPRFCRTHAYIAQLFANTAASGTSAATWNYISTAWEELAGLKERAASEAKPSDARDVRPHPSTGSG